MIVAAKIDVHDRPETSRCLNLLCLWGACFGLH